MNSIASAMLASASAGGSGRTGTAPASPDTGAAAAAAVSASALAAAAPQPAAPAVTVNSDAGRQALEDAIKQIRQFIKSSPATLEFSVDQGSRHVLLRIMDSQTKELILQVPSEEVLAIARALDRFEGVFLSQKA
ncbi:MAG TPA: flagellar protein FlaG [Burkholderiales bacterium]|nr:flagellar protein FlaG [Burkholderiales bacterium]